LLPGRRNPRLFDYGGFGRWGLSYLDGVLRDLNGLSARG
jgi:hypothetical protein